MPRLIWTAQALDGVARLHDFVAGKDQDAAKRAVRAIREGVKVLARNPAIGRPAAEMDPAFREWVIAFGASGYVVLYHLEASEVVLLAVRQGRELGY
ncbi:MAG: type II toxin-antitoxin system RelE/ParE family toxin [Trebonia sp.]